MYWPNFKPSVYKGLKSMENTVSVHLLTLNLLVQSDDNLCKQFGHTSGLKYVGLYQTI